MAPGEVFGLKNDGEPVMVYLEEIIKIGWLTGC